MIILSHRGYWLSQEEKNTEEAFHRSFKLGFGTETDIRDFCGELVISHDIAQAGAMKFRRFLEIHAEYPASSLPLALNIKADGLQKKLSEILYEYEVKNYFLFDMSVPDAIQSIRESLTCFTRMSDVESSPSFYEQAKGVWLDGLYSDWFGVDTIIKHVNSGKSVCIVSPELHGRPPSTVWNRLASSPEILTSDKVFLCTDLPEEARKEFSHV